jgi:hypothetical protein
VKKPSKCFNIFCCGYCCSSKTSHIQDEQSNEANLSRPEKMPPLSKSANSQKPDVIDLEADTGLRINMTPKKSYKEDEDETI